MQTKTKFILLIISFLLGIFVISILQSDDWKLAKLSVRASCGQFTEEENQTYVTVGWTSSNGSVGGIGIEYNDTTTLKHENCHKRQFERYPFILFTCPMQFSKTLIEFECYKAQDLDDKTYLKLYGNYSSLNPGIDLVPPN